MTSDTPFLTAFFCEMPFDRFTASKNSVHTNSVLHTEVRLYLGIEEAFDLLGEIQQIPSKLLRIKSNLHAHEFRGQF